MDRADVHLFRSHSILEEEEIKKRVDAVFRARLFRRRRLAREARREVASLLTPDESERLKLIKLGLLGWSCLVVGSLLAAASTFTPTA